MNSESQREVVWWNGTTRLSSESRLSLADTGFVHGDCVTEMLRTFGHEPFRVQEHLARFRHSVEAALLKCYFGDDELAAAIAKVVENNINRLSDRADLGVILFVTGGVNVTYAGRGVEAPQEHVCVHTFPLHFELWRESLRAGQHLVVSPLQTIPPECMNPTIKSRSRMHWRIGERLVKRDRPGATAVFADAAGNLTETSSANLFVLKDGEVLTPPGDRVLNGISRQVVMELGETAGYIVKEQTVPVETALQADEIWTSSTPYCMLPVTKFNETTISGGAPGPVFQQLLDAWSGLAGVDVREQILQET